MELNLAQKALKTAYSNQYTHPKGRVVELPPFKQPKKRSKRSQFFTSLKRFFSLILMSALCVITLPYTFAHVTKTIFFTSPPNKAVKVDYNHLYKPTVTYLSNNYFLGESFLTAANTKKPQMQPLYESKRLDTLGLQLENLMAQYKDLNPAVYAWDVETGNYLDINADKAFSAASIVKIPILIQLFKSIEAKQLSLDDEMELTDYYKASGSGSLQYKGSGGKYTLDTLAQMMIQSSDNSATNMLMSAYGGKPDINRALRSWGMKKTYVENWLPDLRGDNTTSAREMSTMLYNIDNNAFLTLNSREKIIDYMSHVENNRLIQAGLAPEAIFVHKTGDIGTMLGDAGIVYAPNGKRYIITILVNRKHNDISAKDFIIKASAIIYKYMIS